MPKYGTGEITVCIQGVRRWTGFPTRISNIGQIYKLW